MRPLTHALRFALAVTALFGCSDQVSTAARCEIDLARVATLGENAGPNGPKPFSRMVRSGGKYFVVDTYTPGSVSIFDSTGAYLRSFGRLGNGPGEHGPIDEISGVADTVYIPDPTNKRVSRYLNDGRSLGHFAIPGGTVFTPMTGGGVALIANPRGRPPAQIEVRSTADSAVGSFTIMNEVLANARTPKDPAPKLVDVDGQSVWLTFVGNYLLEQYDYNGTRLSTIKKDLSWFPARDEFQKNITKYDTAASISDLTVLPGGAPMLLIGRLVNLQQLLADRQKAASQTGHEPEAERPIRNPEAVMQVLDPKTGLVIAEKVSKDTTFLGFADASHLWAWRDLADGTPVLDVYRMTLTRRRSTATCRVA